MDPDRYTDRAFGRPERAAGDTKAFWSFLPSPLPRTLDLETQTVNLLSEADLALGHLQGVGRLVADPKLLIGPYLTREAVASSRIEGTQTSLADVLRAEANAPVPSASEVDEVERYLDATRIGIELLGTLPLTQRLLKRTHAALMQGVRGEEKRPGEFRTSPVWVGAAGDTPERAPFVPPLPDHIPDLIADWERFVNDPPALPVLVRCALGHYQFETIHPFLDGNGRIGRLLISLQLMQERRLTTPLLYLSGYFEDNRKTYYERLQAVREEGDIQSWLQFFCLAVRDQAEDAVARAASLVDLRAHYQTVAGSSRSARMPAIVDLLFTNPFVTVRRVREELAISDQGARDLVGRAQEHGWITEIGKAGRGGTAVWCAQDVLRIIEEPAATDLPAVKPD